jgi:hypothetical protein
MCLLDVFACLFAKVYIVHILLAYILTWCCCSVSSVSLLACSVSYLGFVFVFWSFIWEAKYDYDMG